MQSTLVTDEAVFYYGLNSAHHFSMLARKRSTNLDGARGSVLGFVAVALKEHSEPIGRSLSGGREGQFIANVGEVVSQQLLGSRRPSVPTGIQ
jgi:hypothetical protein